MTKLVCIGVIYHRAGLLLEYGMIYRGGLHVHQELSQRVARYPSHGAGLGLLGIRICHSYE